MLERAHCSRQSVLIASLLLSLFVGDVHADGAPVEVVTPKRLTLTQELRLTGTLTAERNARLSPRVDGLVERLEVDAGDRVSAGDALIKLDADLAIHALRRAEAEMAQAQARLSEAQRLVQEARRLVKDRHLPQTELERRESEFALAQAAAAAAQAAQREQAELVRRHILPAPFDGVIARRLTDVGEWVTRGTPILELVATDRIRLDVQAPQERFSAIAADAQVKVRPASDPDRVLPGRIIARVPVGDPGSRTFLVRILIEKPEIPLLPGASATAAIVLRGSQPAVAAPKDALLRYPDGTYTVFVVLEQDGQTIARERRVEIGRSGDEVEILSGLNAGEQIVVRGNESLRDGQSVQIAGTAQRDAS
jgi:RND family efflux transporter MFP subunit